MHGTWNHEQPTLKHDYKMYCMTKPEPKLGNINPKKKKISRTNTDNIMSLKEKTTKRRTYQENSV